MVKHAYDRFRMRARNIEVVILFHYGVKITRRGCIALSGRDRSALSEPRKGRRQVDPVWITRTHYDTQTGIKSRTRDRKGQWLIAYEDDSFRLIKGYGVYPTLTSPHSVVVLN